MGSILARTPRLSRDTGCANYCLLYNSKYDKIHVWPRVGRICPVQCLGALKSASRATIRRASTEYGQVNIVFQVHKCCEFGRRVAVVGNLAGLGAWTASEALSLEWNDGHIWSGSITVPLDQIIDTNNGSHALEYKYIVQSSVHPSDESQVEWMPGDNLHIPSMEYGTTALTVQDTWGFGYREIQFERLAEERMKEMILKEETDTRKALETMAKRALGELSNTLTYCESLMQSETNDDPSVTTLLDADRELAAASERATRLLRANQSLYYMDGV